MDGAFVELALAVVPRKTSFIHAETHLFVDITVIVTEIARGPVGTGARNIILFGLLLKFNYSGLLIK